MDDSYQQVVGYISQQLQQGQQEASIRTQLFAQGWQQPAVDEAFRRYHAMATPSPAAATYSNPTPTSKSRNKFLAIGFGTAVLIIAIAIIIALGMHHASDAPQKSSTVTDTPALQQESADVSRKNDVARVTAGIDEYINNNAGSLPQSITVGSTSGKELNICGSECDPTTSSVVTLDAYKSSAVTIHLFANDLTVPNNETVYVVMQATCSANKLTTGTTRQFAVLYATGTSSRLSQECLTD